MTMTNPTIEIDIAEILTEIKTDQKKLLEEVNGLKLGQAKIEGKIEAIDKKLSGQIESVDEKLSGQIKGLDTKVDQLEKRIGNQEFTNRGVLVGLILVILGGAAKLFGWMPNP